MSIRLDGIVKCFGKFPALHGVSLETRPGEFLALLGPSGSGKTTLLRIIAGLDFADSGTVSFDGRDVTGLKVRDRGVGFVFQHYALFRHMTVADNVAFGLTVRRRRDRPARAEIARRAQELLDLVQLGGLGDRYPAQLSGGQRQRVALARALAVEPRLLLLDEPFGALDARVRKDLRRWLRDLHDRMGLTSIFVTHDQEEALELADRVVVMDHGRIAQVATPRALYEDPASAYVYDFVGESNRVPIIATGGRATMDGAPVAGAPTAGFEGPGDLFFRPHDVRIAAEGLPVEVLAVRRSGGMMRVDGRLAGADTGIELILTGGDEPAPGSRIHIVPNRAALFARDGD